MPEVRRARNLDLTKLRNEASAYLPTITNPAKPTKPSKPDQTETETAPSPPLSPTPARTPLPLPEREEDPLPYLDLNPGAPKRSGVSTNGLPRPAPPSVPATKPQDDTPLSLEDDSGTAPALPPGPPPFRVPALVTDDSAKQFSGLCEVVLVPHGLFLESVPYRPFLYAPVGSPAFTPNSRTVVVSLPDGRAVAIEFLGRDATRLADDTAAFLSRERGLPDPREYRRSPRWLLLVAIIFALGLAIAPVVMSQTTELGLETGLLLGAGFAGFGLLANVAVVLFTCMSVISKMAVMARSSAWGRRACSCSRQLPISRGASTLSSHRRRSNRHPRNRHPTHRTPTRIHSRSNT